MRGVAALLEKRATPLPGQVTLAPEESERLQVWLASNIGTDVAAPLPIDVISGGAPNLTLGVLRR